MHPRLLPSPPHSLQAELLAKREASASDRVQALEASLRELQVRRWEGRKAGLA